MILLYVPRLTWESQLISLVLVSWITFAFAYLLFTQLGKRLAWEKEVVGCLILTAGLGNTSFVGFPILEALLGPESLKYGVLVDQPGTFLICSTFGLWIAHAYSEGSFSKRLIFKKILVFPPFIFFTLSLILLQVGWSAQDEMLELLKALSSTLAPLALISVGLQLKVNDWESSKKYLAYGLCYKLLVTPLLIWGLYRLFKIPEDIFQVAFLESAMAPMITSSILAATFGLRPKLAGLMVGIGVPVSLVTIALWYFIVLAS